MELNTETSQLAAVNIWPGYWHQRLPAASVVGEWRGIQPHNTTQHNATTNGNKSHQQVVMTDTPAQHQNQLSEQTVIQSLDNEDGGLFFQAWQQGAGEF